MTTKAQIIEAITTHAAYSVPEDGTKPEGTKASLEAILAGLNAADEAGEGEEQDEAPKGAMAALKTARQHYVKTVKANGKKSVNSGDPLAILIGDLEPGEVAKLADALKEQEAGFYAAKYAHLNAGQVRMNSSNVIRGMLKRGEATLADVKAAM